jgi:3',5'-nucleoside bisphosphate phosphatase
MTSRRTADLHVHTTASDGTLSPEQVVHEAVQAGLAAIGIADHDAVEGISPALAAGRAAGLVVVPAIEVNTDYGEDELHILGYYIDHQSDMLATHLERLRSERRERVKRMVERLNEVGAKLDLERVYEIAGSGSVGRPHVARALVEAGHVSSMNSAFGKYLVRGAPGYVPRYKLTPSEAIQIIRQAGGVAVLAHPGNSRHDEVIPQLIDAGLEGIEVYHSDHSALQRRHYARIAKNRGLVATGGSDFHGPNMMKMVPIGHVTVDIEIVHKLKELADSRKSSAA